MILFFFFLAFVSPSFAAHYYVAASGSDSNNGTSPGSAWQTVSKVNAGSYSPGDTISFNGGDTFSGTTLSPSLAGSSGNLITVNSYGSGQGIISVGSCGSPAVTHGIFLTNPQYVTITNLTLIGAGWTGSGTGAVVCDGGYGVYLLATNTSGPKLQSVTVSDCNISGFWDGIWVDGGKSGSSSTVGFNSVVITGNSIQQNLSGGILVQGYGTDQAGPVDQITNVTIAGNVVQYSPGDPNSGSGGVHGSIETEAWGINVGNVTGLLVGCAGTPPWSSPFCGNFVSDVGGYGGAKTGLTYGGSAAIAASNASDVTINGNEATRTACTTHFDGAAIDFDQDTTNGEAAWNLTYNNVGPAVQLGSFGQLTTSNIRIHHNISYQDAQGNNAGGTSEQGAFRLYGFSSDSYVFNNTCVILSYAYGVPSCVNFEEAGNASVYLLNNIFKVPGGVSMIHGNQINNPVHIGSPTVLGNLYDSSGGSLLISNDTGSSYTNVTTLAAWRGYGFEILSATDYGVAGASDLTNLAVFSPPANGFIGEGIPISSVGNFNLGPSSVGIGVGINPSLVGVTLGCCDYHGNPALRGSVVDMGANSLVPLPSTTVSGQTSISGQVVVH